MSEKFSTRHLDLIENEATLREQRGERVSLSVAETRELIAATRRCLHAELERDQFRVEIERLVEKVNRYHEEREHYHEGRDEAQAALAEAYETIVELSRSAQEGDESFRVLQEKLADAEKEAQLWAKIAASVL